MLRKRLIFGLIYSNGFFMQSRNFRLQRVGNIDWLEKNYKFQQISFSLDELIVLNATKGNKDIRKFTSMVSRLVENVFIPVAAGGGIRTLADVELLFSNGADKVILNSSLCDDPQLVSDIINKYGAQSVVASIDYKIMGGVARVFIHDGTDLIEPILEEYVQNIQALGVGEIILNSIDQDGTGFGYDISTVLELEKRTSLPLIIMGGAGNKHHLLTAIEGPISAVATANLFNFIGDGLPTARDFLLKENVNIARWC